MQINSQNIILIIAIYGAFLSTIVALWNIYRDFSDKPRIKVRVKYGLLTYHNAPSKDIIIFEAVNTRKRPITLSSAGIELEKGHILFAENTGLPIKLKEGERHTFNRTIEGINKIIKNNKPKYFWFRDNSGNKYKSSKKDVYRILIKI